MSDDIVERLKQITAASNVSVVVEKYRENAALPNTEIEP